MRIAITGASGNLGTALIRALRASDSSIEIVGLCRRPPAAQTGGIDWHAVDLGSPDADPAVKAAFDGCDAVVHLAWAIQPTRQEEMLHRINVGGTARVLRSAAAVGVPHVVHASSLAVYAPTGAGPVDESWPATGVATSAYSRQKVEAEALLGEYQRATPATIFTWVRPTLVVQRNAAAEIAGLFLGHQLAGRALGKLKGRLPLLPLPAGLRMQLVHADDVADAIVRILDRKPSGAFNLAADVLGPAELGSLMGGRPIAVPRSVARFAVGVAYQARMIPTSPGWLDMLVEGAELDSTRARVELDWHPRHSSTDAAGELLDGFADGAHGPTPALLG
ncbi:NAD-dependent epimerase/dehydratase family protein [Sporichthya sp.]|uniref:NAD-dependent epimerase/dehydratase family protein n=1 Tax=Sporichthya sp. TaxID=65475 RepID=UPI0017B050B7|nr:NAD-dependent epimerase/dehydratase family protein [Sporichthya sp.]MBA3744472.1 NAD-dependent epimerase/dehydratase family protein [Sporichthya sp.]